MDKLIDTAFSGFWYFLGMIIILGMIGNGIAYIINRIIRGFNIRKHGWPPSHLDADGDWRPLKEKDQQ